MDHVTAAAQRLGCEPQEGGEDLAAGRAEGTRQTTQAGKVVAK